MKQKLEMQLKLQFKLCTTNNSMQMLNFGQQRQTQHIHLQDK